MGNGMSVSVLYRLLPRALYAAGLVKAKSADAFTRSLSDTRALEGVYPDTLREATRPAKRNLARGSHDDHHHGEPPAAEPHAAASSSSDGPVGPLPPAGRIPGNVVQAQAPGRCCFMPQANKRQRRQ